jgi:glyoxylase-like metal-dependent hydrolase (beta-lactamase superfamily II)
MEIYNITPYLKLMDLQPPIPGYDEFIGSYLFHGDKNAVIDVGPKAAIPNLFKALAELNLDPGEIDFVVLTHIHMDHAGGVGTALREMSRAKVVAHSRAVKHLADPSTLWHNSLKTLGEMALKYGEIEPVPEHRIVAATDQMKLDLGRGVTPEIHLTPGHAAHHLSVFDRASGVLIAGEAAGVCIDGNVRPTTPPPFKLEETLDSIDKLIALNPKKLCYDHFGCYDNAVERLKAYRQEIIDWHKTVGTAAKAGKSPEEILIFLRQEDKNLSYLDKLDKDEYAREFALIINTIRGLAGPAQK